VDGGGSRLKSCCEEIQSRNKNKERKVNNVVLRSLQYNILYMDEHNVRTRIALATSSLSTLFSSRSLLMDCTTSWT
jgi:predicted kinase